MSEKINDGGPAFPTESGGQSGNATYRFEDMTLRDYFAAKAMQSWIAAALQAEAGEESPGMSDFTMEWITDHSYVMADAMIKARQS